MILVTSTGQVVKSVALEYAIIYYFQGLKLLNFSAFASVETLSFHLLLEIPSRNITHICI